MTYIFEDEGTDHRWRQNTGNCRHGIAEVHQFFYTRTIEMQQLCLENCAYCEKQRIYAAKTNKLSP